VAGLGERLAGELAGLEREGLRRRRRVVGSPQGAHIALEGRAVANFAGNDYLGLANHPRLRAAAHAAIDAYGVGAGASPLVAGHLRIHEEAEERFAAFVGTARALLFPSGYAANLGILTALADRHAEIFADRLNHACLNDGALLARARLTRYAHLDMDALERALAASKASLRLVATDTVFSMDGDLAPLPRLAALCERHDAWLVLDDAHGIGVLGRQGRGAPDHFGVASPRIVHMATLGKALGGYGAFVAGAPQLLDWLVQRARTLIYSTALPPMAAGVAIEALALLQDDAAPLANLHARIARFRAAAGAAGLAVADSTTAIQPLVLGDSARALEASARLLERGCYVPAIRPPTVPRGGARLRVSLSAAHAPADVDHLVASLREVLR
jgi:8-amino-7-oxononanoate synthase